MAVEGQPNRKPKRRVVKWAILLIIVLAAAYVLARLMSDARESARSMSCRNHLEEIGFAIHEYASDHDGNLPRGETAVEVFSELIEGGYLTGTYGGYPVYVCPSANDDVEAWERTRKLTEETCSYDWVVGLDPDSPSRFAVAFDKSREHHRPRLGGIPLAVRTGRNVLRVDVSVHWMFEREFQEYMGWQREMRRSMAEGGEYVDWYDWRERKKTTK